MNTSSQALSVFAQIATGFCSWCEGPSLGPDPIKTASSWLCQLHEAALSLEEWEGEEESVPDVPPDQMANAAKNLGYFANWYYRKVFDPDPKLIEPEEPVVAEIRDDLQDIFRDVKSGLIAYELGYPQEAAWRWAFSHQSHWGRHAVSAISALHCLS